MQGLFDWLQGSDPQERESDAARPGEPMTDAKVDYSFGIYWTKMLLQAGWTAEQRQAIRQQVLEVTSQPGFEDNLIEKRYALPLAGIPETMHSGASLRALLDVLTAMDNMEKD